MDSDLQKDRIPPEGKGGTGYLTVKVSTADEAIPLQNALVTIYDGDTGALLYNLRTDRSGNTATVSVSVPEKELSTVPGDVRPYGIVTIDVRYSGYRDMNFSSVPIFDTIVSIQDTKMIPRSDSDRNFIHDYSEALLFNTEENQLNG